MSVRFCLLFRNLEATSPSPSKYKRSIESMQSIPCDEFHLACIGPMWTFILKDHKPEFIRKLRVKNISSIYLLCKVRIAVAFPQFICTWQRIKRLARGQWKGTRGFGTAITRPRKEFVKCNPVWMFARYTSRGNTNLKLLQKCSQTSIHSLYIISTFPIRSFDGASPKFRYFFFFFA
jgi:hypothetical protein